MEWVLLGAVIVGVLRVRGRLGDRRQVKVLARAAQLAPRDRFARGSFARYPGRRGR